MLFEYKPAILPQTPEEKILQIISEFSPTIFKRIADMQEQNQASNRVCYCFVALMSTIIYEKSEEEQE